MNYQESVKSDSTLSKIPSILDIWKHQQQKGEDLRNNFNGKQAPEPKINYQRPLALKYREELENDSLHFK